MTKTLIQPSISEEIFGAKVSITEMYSYPKSLIAFAGNASVKSCVVVNTTETIFFGSKLFFSTISENKCFEDSIISSLLFFTVAIAPRIPFMSLL